KKKNARLPVIGRGVQQSPSSETNKGRLPFFSVKGSRPLKFQFIHAEAYRKRPHELSVSRPDGP
ncbi:MAG: hypothetical protein K2I26_08760, partial [Paramuribaculum sp.]|nr:hypothetical protein [Paramuribaculum sp.]